MKRVFLYPGKTNHSRDNSIKTSGDCSKKHSWLKGEIELDIYTTYLQIPLKNLEFSTCVVTGRIQLRSCERGTNVNVRTCRDEQISRYA